MNRPVRREFDNNIHQYYGTGLLEALDFSSTPQAIKNSYDHINQLVDTATRGQITKAVHAKDVIQAKMIVVSALFFKGQWTVKKWDLDGNYYPMISFSSYHSIEHSPRKLPSTTRMIALWVMYR